MNALLEQIHLPNPSFASVSAQDLEFFFGRELVLHRVAFEAPSGSITAIVGPNGSGKTTLLRVLATLLTPAAGCVHVDDKFVAHDVVETYRRHLGFVAHNPMLYDELSARENLELFSALHGVDADIQSWLRAAALSEVEDRRVSALSRGMKQRLAVIRALLHNPTLVLFDEVMTGLDRSARRFVYEVLRLLRTRGRIILMVTHHFDHPDDIVDRVIALDRGATQFAGPLPGSLAELYTQTSTTRDTGSVPGTATIE